MPRKIFLYPALSISFLVLILHLLALRYYLYFFYWWFDLLTHTLAGVSVALVAVWFVTRDDTVQIKPLKIFFTSFISSLFVGVGWEVFEYSFSLTLSSKNYIQDTTLDITTTALGGTVVSVYAIYSLLRLGEKKYAK